MNSIPLQIDQIGHTTEFLHPTRQLLSGRANRPVSPGRSLGLKVLDGPLRPHHFGIEVALRKVDSVLEEVLGRDPKSAGALLDEPRRRHALMSYDSSERLVVNIELGRKGRPIRFA
jgi:hypothetical protein